MNITKGHLKAEERSQIYLLLKKHFSHRDIADALSRDHTTIGREIRRNSAGGIYDPHRAKQKARTRRMCSKYQGMKLRGRPELEAYVKQKLKAGWAPETIAGRLKEKDTHLPYISSKGIYKWLYSAHGQAYCPCLFRQRYSPKKRKAKKTKREMIQDRIGIECRPEAVSGRREYGHFEGDTIVSARRHKTSVSLSVLSERTARYARLKKIKNLKPATNRRAVERMAEGLYRKTLTLDNGIENKEHTQLSRRLSIDVYFCDPYSSWQKGGVENMNGIIRRFIPKGADINDYSDKNIQMIEDYLNHTPRKCLKFKTPHEVMTENNLFLNQKQPGGAFEG